MKRKKPSDCGDAVRHRVPCTDHSGGRWAVIHQRMSSSLGAARKQRPVVDAVRSSVSHAAGLSNQQPPLLRKKDGTDARRARTKPDKFIPAENQIGRSGADLTPSPRSAGNQVGLHQPNRTETGSPLHLNHSTSTGLQINANL